MSLSRLVKDESGENLFQSRDNAPDSTIYLLFEHMTSLRGQRYYNRSSVGQIRRPCWRAVFSVALGDQRLNLIYFIQSPSRYMNCQYSYHSFAIIPISLADTSYYLDGISYGGGAEDGYNSPHQPRHDALRSLGNKRTLDIDLVPRTAFQGLTYSRNRAARYITKMRRCIHCFRAYIP